MADIDPMWVGAAGVISAIGTFIAGQRHGKAEFLTAVSKASEIVITRLTKECHRMEEAGRKCEEGHAQCRDEVASLHVKMAEISGLMRSDVAVYRPTDLTRVGDT